MATDASLVPASIAEQLDELLAMKIEIEDLEAETKQAKAAYESLNDKLSEKFALEGIQSVNKDDNCFYRSKEVYASISEAQRAAAFEYLRSVGAGDLIKETPSVHAGTLKAWVKERLDQAGDNAINVLTELNGFMNIFDKHTIRIKRA